MKVLYFCADFPLVSETFITYEIHGLIQRGVDIQVMSLTDVPAEKRSGLPEALGFAERLHVRRPLIRNAGRRRLRTVTLLTKLLLKGQFGALARLLSDITTSAEYSRYILLETAESLNAVMPDADIVFCHFGTMGRLGAILKHYKLIDQKLVTTFHGYDASTYLKKHPKTIYNMLFDYADMIITVNRHFQDVLKDLGAPAEKMEVVHCAVDTKEFEYLPRNYPKERPLHLICTGRLTEKKGHKYLIQTMHHLRQKRPEVKVHLDLIGDGPTRTEIEDLINTLELKGDVTLHGAIQHSEVQKLLKAAHIFVLHSVVAEDGDKEGIPVALMEAMASGLPVISTRHSGIPELIDHGQSGLLGEERNAEELCEHIEYLIDHPDEWKQLTRNARDKIEAEFNPETEVAKLKEKLEAL